MRLPGCGRDGLERRFRELHSCSPGHNRGDEGNSFGVCSYDGRRFIVRAEEKLTAFLELEEVLRRQEHSRTGEN